MAYYTGVLTSAPASHVAASFFCGNRQRKSLSGKVHRLQCSPGGINQVHRKAFMQIDSSTSNATVSMLLLRLLLAFKKFTSSTFIIKANVCLEYTLHSAGSCLREMQGLDHLATCCTTSDSKSSLALPTQEQATLTVRVLPLFCASAPAMVRSSSIGLEFGYEDMSFKTCDAPPQGVSPSCLEHCS